MYEVKQNKEKVIRRIEGGGMVRQRMNVENLRSRIVQENIFSSPVISNLKIAQLRNLPNKEYSDFSVKEYTFEYKGNFRNSSFQGIGNAGFKTIYKPNEKNVNIILPIKWNSKDGQQEKAYFITNVHDTWSNKFIFKTNAQGLESDSSLSTKNEWAQLNNVGVEVYAVENNDAPLFEINYNTKNADSVSGGTAKLSEQGYKETLYSWDPTASGALGTYGSDKLNVYGHEAGHMFGLGDENLTSKNQGQQTQHYHLTELAFQQDYADKHAVRNATYDKKDGDNRESIMSWGNIVQKHHYVTFWDAMVKSIQEKYPTNENVPKLHEDWEISN